MKNCRAPNHSSREGEPDRCHASLRDGEGSEGGSALGKLITRIVYLPFCVERIAFRRVLLGLLEKDTIARDKYYYRQ